MTTAAPSAEIPWTHFVRRHGDEAAAWVADFDRHADSLNTSFQALRAIRAGQFDDGERLLADYEADLLEASEPDTTVRWILQRYLYAVRAYGCYRQGAGEDAEFWLDAAMAAIARSIAVDPFLVTQAAFCAELTFHKAKIARDDHRWDAMFQWLDEAGAMTAGDQPLCVLEHGESIDFETIERFFDSLGDHDEAEQAFVTDELSKEVRMARFDDVARQLLAIPTFAIRYP